MNNTADSAIVVGELNGALLPQELSKELVRFMYRADGNPLQEIYQLQQEAEKRQVDTVILIDPPSYIVAALFRFHKTSGTLWHLGSIQKGIVQLTWLPLRAYRPLAQVFIKPDMVPDEDGLVMFSQSPKASAHGELDTPVLIDLKKVTSNWPYTDENGGWVNIEAIQRDLTHWRQAMPWTSAWRSITWE